MQTNVLSYGDNLIFRDESGNATDAQLRAFEDTLARIAHRPRRPTP